MMEWEQQQTESRQSTRAAFMLVALLLGVAGALQMPVVSLFLTQQTSASPMMVGLFYAVNAIAGLVISQWVAVKSDSGNYRHRLILLCCSVAIVNALLFAFNRHYSILITLGVIMSALATTAMPQLFAHARQYADRAQTDVVTFTTRMRVQISLSWVVAPPLGFYLIAHFSFTLLYLMVAALFALSLLLVALCLPSLNSTPAANDTHHDNVEKSPARRTEAWFLFIALAMLWGSDTMYLIDMPIYISQLPGVVPGFAGWLLGGAAGMEILIMLFCAKLINRFGKRPMMLVAAGSAALFYLGMAKVETPTLLIAIQLFNAIFIGLVGALGMLYLQDLLPGKSGTASTLYTNSITTGAVFAGLLQGIVSQYWGHQAIYCAALMLSLVALLLLLKVREA